MSKSLYFKNSFEGREFDVLLVENEKKTSIRLDMGANLEIRTRFDKMDQIEKEVGLEKMTEWYQKAIEAQETERFNVFKNRKELKAFAEKAFEEIRLAENKLGATLVVKGMSTDYSRVNEEDKIVILNLANEIKNEDFVREQIKTQLDKITN